MDSPLCHGVVATCGLWFWQDSHAPLLSFLHHKRTALCHIRLYRHLDLRLHANVAVNPHLLSTRPRHSYPTDESQARRAHDRMDFFVARSRSDSDDSGQHTSLRYQRLYTFLEYGVLYQCGIVVGLRLGTPPKKPPHPPPPPPASPHPSPKGRGE